MTSHVPHVLANVVVNQAGAARIEGHEPLANAGGSLRDMTRVAGANPRIWVDIFLDNAPRSARRSPSTAAGSSRSRRRSRRRRRVPRALDRRGRRQPAADARAGVRRRRRAAPRCVCTSPTGRACSPAITQALGAERINIEDFELQHISPERGGTMTLLVTGEGEARARRRRCWRRRATASSSPRCSMSDRCEPGRARRRGHIASRATSRSRTARLLIGALCEGETRVRGCGPLGRHRVDARAPCAPSASRWTRTDVDSSSSTASACAGSRAGGPIDCGNAGTLVRLVVGILAVQDGRFELDRRRVALAPADGARRGAAAADGRRARDDRRLPADRRSTAASCRRSTTSCRSRARRSSRRCCSPGSAPSGRTTVVEPAPTRDHTELMLPPRAPA